MEHITVGKSYNEGKVAKIECIKNCSLKNINIKGKCFLLIILSLGKMKFCVGEKIFIAVAPAFISFDETADPKLISKSNAEYTCIFFHPEYLNINMSFEMLRLKKYNDIASTHDMFLLKPFIDKAYVIPIAQTQLEKIIQSADYMQEELNNQRDWYWSCRGRSYFMEIIIALERMYGLIGYGMTHQKSDNTHSHLSHSSEPQYCVYDNLHSKKMHLLSTIYSYKCQNSEVLSCVLPAALKNVISLHIPVFYTRSYTDFLQKSF